MMMQSMRNAFTVDLEDWFQGLTSTNPRVDLWPTLESRVEHATDLLLRILDEHRVKATFFVLGHVADHHPALVERIAADGHELGVHGYWHKFVSRLTPDEFAQELDAGVAAVMRITGAQPLGHRAPYFSVTGSTPWAFSQLRARGFQYDSSVFPTRNMLYGFPGAPRYPYRVEGAGIVEFPASTAQVAGKNMPVAGGFYVRALPYVVTRQAIRSINAEGLPAVMYVHPWELDTEQRYTKVTARERITHYHGRKTLAAKLHQLLDDFDFTTLGELYAHAGHRLPTVQHGTPSHGAPSHGAPAANEPTHTFPDGVTHPGQQVYR